MSNIDINVRKKNNLYKDSLLYLKKRTSGEIFKEPFLDILLTDLEQTSFSLITSTSKKKTQNGTGFFTLKQSGGLTKRLAKAKAVQKAGLTKPCKNEPGRAQTSFVQPAGLFARRAQTSFVQGFVRKSGGPGFDKAWQSQALFLYGQEQHNLKTLPFVKTNRGFAQAARPKLAHKEVIKFIANSRNNNLKTSSYLFALDKWIVTSYISFLFDSSTKNKKTFQAIKSTINLNSSNWLHNKKPISCLLNIGDYVHCGDKLGYNFDNNASQSLALRRIVSPLVVSESGKLLKINKSQVTIQKMQPVLFYSQAEIHVESNEWVKRGTPLLTLAHQTLVTGDIVQGIPRIEQLFEASTSAPPGAVLQDFDFQSEDYFPLSRKRQDKVAVTKALAMSKLEKASSSSDLTKENGNQGKNLGLSQANLNINQQIDDTTHSNSTSTVHFVTEEKPLLLYQTLQSQVRETFRKKWKQLPLSLAVRQSLEEIQQIIVESIQKVYISQGVLIADKHIEIIVRQMTSKAQIFDGGSTGLLIDEILSLQQIENANISTPGQKAVYLPVIMGLTRAALSSDSFVSAASFQETTRVLSRDAVAGKTDFLRGLKEKVIIGDLIDAGTGLDVFYIYSLFSKNIFENKFRDILNRKITHKTLKKLLLTVTKCYPDGLKCTKPL